MKAFVGPIRRSLSCFTKADVRPSGYKAVDAPLLLLLGQGEPVKLKGCDLSLYIVQHFAVVPTEGERGPYKVRTTGYEYAIYENERESIAYHWHPYVNEQAHPHVHVPDSAVSRAHVPTGRVSIEHVLVLARDMGAEPLRPDWEKVVGDSLARFENWRTWG